MSRIGRLPIALPKGVTVKPQGTTVLVEGPKGKAQHALPPRIGISVADGTVILTHENRHLLLKPELKIVHLDDWEPQQVYGKPAADRVALLDKLGVAYYLYVPNESRHIANSWLGMEELIKDGYFVRDLDTPSLDEGNADYPLEVTARNMNVLYKRSGKKP